MERAVGLLVMLGLAGKVGLADRDSSGVDSGVFGVLSDHKGVLPAVNGVEDWHEELELVWRIG